MPDHVNINRPKNAADDDDFRQRLKLECLETELRMTRERLYRVTGDLQAVFTRLEQGFEVEFWLDPDRCMIVTEWEPRGDWNSADVPAFDERFTAADVDDAVRKRLESLADWAETKRDKVDGDAQPGRPDAPWEGAENPTVVPGLVSHSDAVEWVKDVENWARASASRAGRRSAWHDMAQQIRGQLADMAQRKEEAEAE